MVFDSADALHGLIGGALIGIASAIMLLALGRVAGISGIAATIFSRTNAHRSTNIAFVVGLVLMPLIYGLITSPPAIGITSDLVLLIAGGLLVGIGTRVGNGCTSGHGVCGLSRFSPRSIVATLVFMAAGIIVASFVVGMIR